MSYFNQRAEPNTHINQYAIQQTRLLSRILHARRRQEGHDNIQAKFYSLMTCLMTSLHFPLINLPISKADSRFYNWQVQRSLHTQSQGDNSPDIIHQQIDQNAAQFIPRRANIRKGGMCKTHTNKQMFPPF